jgi:hypothetical protein
LAKDFFQSLKLILVAMLILLFLMDLLQLPKQGLSGFGVGTHRTNLGRARSLSSKYVRASIAIQPADQLLEGLLLLVLFVRVSLIVVLK